MKERVEQVRQQRGDRGARPRPAAVADRRHRRLHERRQVHAAQRARRLARSPWPRTSSSPRSTRRAARSSSATARRRSSPTPSGFIHKLPHQLVDAFRATLEEVNRADVLIEVVDASDAHVERAPGDRPDRPRRARRRRQAPARRLQQGRPARPVGARRRRRRRRPSAGAAFVSALTGYGLDTLRAEIAALLASLWVDVDVAVPYAAGELLARVRERGTVELEYRERDVRVVGRVRAVAGGRARGGRRAAGPRSSAAATGSSAPSDDRAAAPARAGVGSPTARRVTWTISEGRRGRRWREVVADGPAVRHALLLETDPTGRFSHLELASAAGLWTFHPEADGTLHGNHVDPGRRRGHAHRRRGRSAPTTSSSSAARRSALRRDRLARSPTRSRPGASVDRAGVRLDPADGLDADRGRRGRATRGDGAGGSDRRDAIEVDRARRPAPRRRPARRRWRSADRASSWMRCGQPLANGADVPRKSWISPFPAPGRTGYRRSCPKGPQTESGVAGVYIGGADYGPAVPSGVSVSPTRSSAVRCAARHGSASGVDHPARTHRRRHPRRPRHDRPGLHRLAAVRPRGPVGAGSASRSSSRSRPSTRSARSRAAGRGSRSTRWRGRGPSARPGRSSSRRPATSARASPTPRGRSASSASSSRRATRTAARSAGCARSGRPSSRSGRTSTTPAPAAAAYVADHDAHLLVDGEDPRISTGAATMALELTDAVAAGHLPPLAMASVPVGNGALINGVGSWLRATAPGCRIVGIGAAGAPAMTLSWRAGRPIDTDAVGDLRRRHRVARRDPRGASP